MSNLHYDVNVLKTSKKDKLCSFEVYDIPIEHVWSSCLQMFIYGDGSWHLCVELK